MENKKKWKMKMKSSSIFALQMVLMSEDLSHLASELHSIFIISIRPSILAFIESSVIFFCAVKVMERWCRSLGIFRVSGAFEVIQNVAAHWNNTCGYYWFFISSTVCNKLSLKFHHIPVEIILAPDSRTSEVPLPNSNYPISPPQDSHAMFFSKG